MKALGIVLSVGVSMLDDFRKWLERRGSAADDGLVSVESRSETFRRYIEEFENNLQTMDPRARQLRYPCAELQTLGIFFAGNEELQGYRKHVTLFYARSRDGAACAHALRWLLEKRETAEPLLGGAAEVGAQEFALNLDDQAEFALQIVDLLARIRRRTAEYRRNGCERILVCITGGYKVLTPFLSLLGFLDGEEVLYGYETSRSVLRVPHLPFAWDMRFLDEFRACLAATELPGAVYEALPGKFKPFFLSEPRAGPGGPVHAKSVFGRMISADYRERRHLRFGYGEPLLARLKDDGLRDRLERLIQTEWEYLWLGDQIPETVEHARGHSTRLMELARDLLALTRLSLADHELFALVAAIWLHDIGHSALVADSIRVDGEPFPLFLFPSLVRDVHHLLSAELIAGLGCLERDTRAAVALMTRYHRREMPLLAADRVWTDDLFGLSASPLLAVAATGPSVEGKPLSPPRLVLLTGLLRFLDACDVQADRVVNEDYARARRRRTDSEIRVYLDRLERLVVAALLEGGCGAEELARIAEGVKGALDRWNGDEACRAARKKLRLEILAGAVEALRQSRCPGEVVALGMADGILFKREQEAHFLKHSAIQCVYLGPGDGGPGDRPAVRVYLLAAVRPERIGLEPEGREAALSAVKRVAEDIWQDYGAARAVLDEAFRVEGVFWNDGERVVRVDPEGFSG